MSRIGQIILLTLLAALGLWIFLTSRIHYPDVIRIGDGSPQGRYAALNKALYPYLAAALKKKFGSRLERVHTQGSLENLRRITDGDLHLAFYQEGVGHADQVRSVINLEYESVYWVVKSNSGIQTLADLQGKRVNLGPKASGTYILSNQILNFYPVTDYTPVYYSFDEAARRMEELDAAFFVAGVQTPVITNLLATGQYQLRPLDFAPAMRLSHSWISPRQIPAQTFQRIPVAIPPTSLQTLGVKSSIIAGQSVPPAIVETVVRTILETPFTLNNNLVLLRNTKRTGFAHTDTQFHLHEGAGSYFFLWEPTIPSDFVESWNGIIGLLVLILSASYTLFAQIRQRREAKRQILEMAKKNALDLYVQQLEKLCMEVKSSLVPEDLWALRRQLSQINLAASADYRDEHFRSSEDFTAFTTQANFMMSLINSRIQETTLAPNNLLDNLQKKDKPADA